MTNNELEQKLYAIISNFIAEYIGGSAGYLYDVFGIQFKEDCEMSCWIEELEITELNKLSKLKLNSKKLSSSLKQSILSNDSLTQISKYLINNSNMYSLIKEAIRDQKSYLRDEQGCLDEPRQIFMGTLSESQRRAYNKLHPKD
jgi:hypothetical protein